MLSRPLCQEKTKILERKQISEKKTKTAKEEYGAEDLDDGQRVREKILCTNI